MAVTFGIKSSDLLTGFTGLLGIHVFGEKLEVLILELDRLSRNFVILKMSIFLSESSYSKSKNDPINVYKEIK